MAATVRSKKRSVISKDHRAANVPAEKRSESPSKNGATSSPVSENIKRNRMR
jgi:hypothetical protein